MLDELLYADDLVLTSETIEGLRNKFYRWKEASESKGLKVNLGQTMLAALQRIACLKVKLTHVVSAA